MRYVTEGENDIIKKDKGISTFTSKIYTFRMDNILEVGITYNKTFACKRGGSGGFYSKWCNLFLNPFYI